MVLVFISICLISSSIVFAYFCYFKPNKPKEHKKNKYLLIDIIKLIISLELFVILKNIKFVTFVRTVEMCAYICVDFNILMPQKIKYLFIDFHFCLFNAYFK